MRFEVTADFTTAGYCHCTHCRRRTGGASSAQVRVPRSVFRLVSGTESLRSYRPEGGRPKLFCKVCGSSLFSGDPLADDEVTIRAGVLDGDPSIEFRYRAWVDSAVSWEPIPDDGIPRYGGARPA